MTPDRWAFVAAVLALLVVTALVLVTVRLHRARQYARLRARLFEVGNETERERDAALAAFHLAADRVMDYDRETRATR